MFIKKVFIKKVFEKIMFRNVALALTIATLMACGGQGGDEPQEVKVTAAPAVVISTGGSVSITTINNDQTDWHNPDTQQWNTVQQYRIDLSMAPPVHQSVNLRYEPTAAPQPLDFRIANDGERLYLQLQWDDATNNSQNAYEKFSDGVAVQFALAGGAMTSFMMGAPNGAVNIWYWKANTDKAQNLAAGGFGSTTLLEQQNVNSASAYENGRWSVVMSRPLSVEGQYQADLHSGKDIRMAFAQWQGETKQRDGLKRVTMGWVLGQHAVVENTSLESNVVDNKVAEVSSNE